MDADKFENIEIVARSWRQSSSRYQDYLWTRDSGVHWEVGAKGASEREIPQDVVQSLELGDQARKKILKWWLT